MPRHARILLSGAIYHIVQRGHNRKTIFRRERDRRYYLANIRELKRTFQCKIYAFCLMSNHVHLVAEPGPDPKSLSLFMKHLAGRQTRYVNRSYQRTGTLWEGRFHSSPIDGERYLLSCCRYVELNPVRAGMVASPQAYPWSSYLRRALGGGPSWLDVDPWYQGLGATDLERQDAYRRFMLESITEEEWDVFRLAAQQNKAAGGEPFIKDVQQVVGWDILPHPRGRPLKHQDREKPVK